MKKLFILFAIAAMLFAGGCSKEYDDSALNGRVDNLENRVAKLEELCRQMNTNISSLQTLVTALQASDYVTGVTPLTENGREIGYTLTFAKSGPIVIYHGKDGANGSDGQNGSNGADGKDGHSPVIGAKTDTDGVIYWTLDGEWLLDENGHKIPVQGADGQDGADGQPGANGKDGVTPQLKIEEGYWYISYDNGASWTQLGKATGENGADGANGEAFFQDVTQDADYVYLTLSTGEQIVVPKHHPLSITFDKTDEICVQANQTYSIGYTLTGADEQTVVKALAQDGFRAVVKKTDNATGTIEITTPATVISSEVLVFVSDGKERTIMRSINFVEGVILITTKSSPVGNDGGTVKIDLSTNLDYKVEIPEADKAWISVAKIESRAAMRDETVTLEVEPNSTPAARYSEVRLVDAFGITGETILITQEAGTTTDDTDIVHFPDELFKEYMVANFDINKDGEISKYEASLITEIGCQNRSLQSLEGIQYCTALTYLTCDENLLAALDVSKNTKLKRLDCSDNLLTSLDVSGCSALTQLYCYKNRLTTLDVSNNTALTTLSCHENQLTALDISNNTALTNLSCASNQLTNLDISNNTALEDRLFCEDNPIEVLNCGEANPLLIFLQGCSSTKLKVIGTKITQLSVSGSDLQSLDVSECPALTYLYCENTQLTTLDVSHNTALKYLHCYYSPLISLDVSKNTALTNLYCNESQLTTLDVSGCSALNSLYCENNRLTTLDLSKNTALTQLICYDNQLTTLDISGCSALTYLGCYNNQLPALDVSNNTRLTSLNCQSNQLTALNVSNNTRLTSLNCSYNQLTSLDVNKNTGLTELDCRKNQLTTLDVSKTSLERNRNNPLRCSGMPTLQTLYLKTGWKIQGINVNRSSSHIPEQTEILYKD